MSPIEIRAAKLKGAEEIIAKAKAAARDLTPEEVKSVETFLAEVEQLNEQIETAQKSSALIERFGQVNGAKADPEPEKKARTLGDHFAKCVGGEKGFARLRTRGVTLESTEFKADKPLSAHLVGDDFEGLLNTTEQTIVRGFRRPTIASLFGTGNISGTSVTYYQERSNVDGSPAGVAEGGKKPQLHFGNPFPVTDRVVKIPAWWDTSDEMVEDLPFMVSEINNRGLYLLGLEEERQLLHGDGNEELEGILQRSNVQYVSKNTPSDPVQDVLFQALTAVSTATGLQADGIIINPQDYQDLRLSKDANGQYFGGGFFSGAYAQDGFVQQPPIWGYNTVVSPAVRRGRAVVGAFKAATTIYRKGGVRVAVTNSDGDKFTTNILTTRIEERLALAVHVPEAIVEVAID